jgi:phosphatidylinositol 4-kinase
MLDVMTFLMRWLFLSNLLRDVAEIQTIPQEDQPPPHTTVDPSSIPPLLWEEYWRNQCIHGILSCPPGSQRLLTIDALRVDLVQQLSHQIRDDQTILQRHRQRIVSLPSRQGDKENETPEEDSEDDPYRDADLEILKALESAEREAAEGAIGDAEAAPPSHLAAYFSISGQGDVNASSEKRKENAETICAEVSPERRAWAIRSTQQTRDFLPQIVAAVLKSPPATNPSLANPVQRLRQVLLDRCLQDPSWGIEMCWLLESEVGRAWKTLFEHRQQTGRRLIVVLPAEKAAVLAKIGSEKHEAFDLLQDAEQATAYGYRMDEPVADAYPAMPSEEKRLPSSLSLRRCSHFGDTMHFIDRLTQISLDLRSVPTIHRHQYLQEWLQEMNRRIRRRMVTRGEISLDVDDHRGPLEWPNIGDLRQDMLKHSVHFPLVPQSGGWPSGRETDATSFSTRSTESPKVVRVLNVVASESRLLSSRERCPFLVHMEVADTDMDGSDARLYATGARDVGSTVEEALRLLGKQGEGSQSYQIPNELLSARPSSVHHPGSATFSISTRGGCQAEQSTYPEEGAYYTDQNPYDSVRQQELENLHRQMYLGQSGQTHQMVPNPAQPHVSTGHELLDKIFGEPWAKKCREIREQSPFGQVRGWRLASFIMKAGEDIRREALVMQIISKLGQWFEEDIPAEHKPYMRPYTIMSVGGDAGLVECLSDAKSVDEVKKETDNFVSLREYFERAYGPPSRHQRRASVHPRPSGAISFETAQDNFLRSLVGYSLVCYILQIKDRHNANILIDREGHIMHIDFGFVLGDTPKMAKVPIFSERAPFKLSQEFWDVLGGWNFNEGGLGVRFCKMFELAFACASSHADEIASLVEATMLALHPDARTARLMARGVRSRLEMRGPPGSTEQKMFIMSLVNAALTSWGTTTYDWLQKSMNGYQ